MLRRHHRAESTGFRWMNRHRFGWLTKVSREGKGMDPNPYLGSEEPTTQAGRRRRAWPAGCRRRSRRRRCCSSEARAVVLLPWVGRASTVGLLLLLLQRPPQCAAPTRALHVTQGEERSAYVRNRRRGRGGAECRAHTWSWRGTPPSWPWTACLWSPGRRDEAPRDKIPRTEWLVGSEWIRLGENGREGGARSRLW